MLIQDLAESQPPGAGISVLDSNVAGAGLVFGNGLIPPPHADYPYRYPNLAAMQNQSFQNNSGDQEVQQALFQAHTYSQQLNRGSSNESAPYMTR